MSIDYFDISIEKTVGFLELRLQKMGYSINSVYKYWFVPRITSIKHGLFLKYCLQKLTCSSNFVYDTFGKACLYLQTRH